MSPNKLLFCLAIIFALSAAGGHNNTVCEDIGSALPPQCQLKICDPEQISVLCSDSLYGMNFGAQVDVYPCSNPVLVNVTIFDATLGVYWYRVFNATETIPIPGMHLEIPAIGNATMNLEVQIGNNDTQALDFFIGVDACFDAFGIHKCLPDPPQEILKFNEPLGNFCSDCPPSSCVGCDIIVGAARNWKVEPGANKTQIFLSRLNIICSYLPDLGKTCNAIQDVGIPQFSSMLASYKNDAVCQKLQVCLPNFPVPKKQLKSTLQRSKVHN